MRSSNAWPNPRRVLRILDHHVTAQAALAGLLYAYFDMEEKAARCWPGNGRTRSRHPRLLQYIQDKDLWEWRLPKSREINAALDSYPFDFQVWDNLTQDTLELGRPGDSSAGKTS